MPVATFGTLGLITEIPAAPPLVPIIYLHGWGRSRNDFAPVANQRPGMLLDLPGFGSSAQPPVAMGSAEYATAVLEAVTEWTDSETVLLVGHSFGGRIALQIAATAPQSVRGLIIAGTPLFRTGSPTRPPLAYRVARRLHKLGLASDARLESSRKKHGSADYLAASGVMRETLIKVVNESYETELTQIRCPTAFVWGRADSAAPVEDARQAQQIVEGSILVERDCGHDIHLQHPSLFVELIDRLVQQ
ncbi:MAG: alpha/beta hydrolase [Acidimicrobiaceae bacterium]|nr:alpha/beta hydrolase [Acidimicrobiaceae bacterium]MYA75085.1 alpha/beta hydrolase [Acidimicrobiaceae bacterium]MYC43294.1 alpha/beta hydrolase [Acidimicrobiaceae bacterium]MYG55489.1 alpha/beta hydrolase [Acidimicrobiaceae bacterium]MYJ99292.1 alpha/beta hydrolase [Acidimicrobiaceae bacterium]